MKVAGPLPSVRPSNVAQKASERVCECSVRCQFGLCLSIDARCRKLGLARHVIDHDDHQLVKGTWVYRHLAFYIRPFAIGPHFHVLPKAGVLVGQRP